MHGRTETARGASFRRTARETVERAAVRWVGWIQAHALLVAALTALLTAAVGAYAVANFKVTTSTRDMLDDDLPFRVAQEEMREAFPHLVRMLVIVVDGDNADLVSDTATALTRRLQQRDDLFTSVFDPLSDDFFRRNGLLYLDVDELQDVMLDLSDAQPFLGTLAQDPSLRGLATVLGDAADALRKGEEDAARIAPVFAQAAAAVEASRGATFHRLSWKRLMAGEELSAEETRRFILVQPVSDYTKFKPAGKAMAAIRTMGRDLGITPDRGMRLRLTGTVALQDEELESVASGTGLAGVASLVLVAVFLVVGLGSLRLVFATLVTLIVGLIWTGGFAVAALGAFNMVSVAFVVLFIGLGVDFGIHFALRHREAVLGGRAQGDALRHAAARLIRPLSLCALTNVIAFFAFAPTSYRGVADLGIISGVGMIVALFCNFTVLPAILTLLPLRKPGESRVGAALEAAAAGIGAVLGRGGRPVVVGAGVLALLALAAAPALRFDPDPLHLKDPTTESVQTMFELLADRETGSPAISVLAPDSEAARAMAARLDALPEVDRVVDVADFVPKRQDEKRDMIDQTALFLLPSLGLGTDAPPTPQEEREALGELLAHLDRLLAQGEASVPSAERLQHALQLYLRGPGATDAGIDKLRRVLMETFPGRLQELRQSLEPQPVSLADLPADLVARLQAPDGLQRLEVYPAENVVDPAAMARFVRAVQVVAPAATGGPVAIVEAGDSVVRSVVQALAIAAVAIVIVLYGVLGTWRDTALVIAPVLLAAVLAMGTVVLLGMSINFANVIAVPLLLGLGVDSCIHIVTRAREQADVRRVLTSSTSRAVLFSALTTVGSFGTLMLSSHRGTASIGELLAITIGLTLVCALVVLPALIATFGAAARTAPEAETA